ncbi:MAG: bifunctional precorrin-2 dehydrogenase/sirohydrochlorin ferrochelatase [Bacteroidota bacterium]|nr:bifunctional precorrin-2 dehydrogenase/sirohydrochlorin ferrochelatase [Bacteroidota bacterium]
MKLKNVPCLVVGGGAVASRKVKGLLESGARVTVISPEISPELLQLALTGNINYLSRIYQTNDCKGFQLVFAATSDKEADRQIAQEASANIILHNIASEPDECDFFVPSQVSRGLLQIAVSTSGIAPSLAKEIRLYLESMFGDDLNELLEHLKIVRQEVVLEARGDETSKKRLMDERVAPLVSLIISKLRK